MNEGATPLKLVALEGMGPIYLLDRRPVFPPPDRANEEGLLAIGGDLSAERLLEAYRHGIFPWYEAWTPAIAEVNTAHLYQVALNDVVANGMSPEQAMDKAINRAEKIFAKYPIKTA